MKKHVLILIAFLISCNLFNQSGNLKKATEAEVVGKTADALGLYVDALLKVSPSAEIPDVNRSKFVESSLWRKEIEKHIIWLHTPPERIYKGFQNILEGVERCAGKVHTENSLVKIKMTKYTPDQYVSDWNRMFFAPTVKADPSFGPMVDKNYNDNFSIIKITAPKNYTYNICMINKTTGKQTTFNLYPEFSRSILGIPGDYLLVCRSTITFPTNQIWYSQYSVFQLTIPQQASKVTAELRTSVARERTR